MKCSAVLCSYNGGRFLREQLQSIANQSRLPDQIVFVDDHSSDDSWQQLRLAAESFSTRGINVQLHRNAQTLGVTANFQRAIGLASGDVICLSDQDDRWKHNRLLETMAAFEADPDLLCFNANADVIDASGKRVGRTLFEELHVTDTELESLRKGDMSRILPERNLSTGATMAFRSSIRNVILPFPQHFVHDDWISGIAWLVGRTTTTLKPLIDYRIHSGNSVGLHNLPQSVAAEGEHPRLTHLRWQLRRIGPMLQRLEVCDALHHGHAQQLSSLQKHLTLREAVLAGNRGYNLLTVLRELGSGRYHRFSRGMKSALSDVVLVRKNVRS